MKIKQFYRLRGQLFLFNNYTGIPYSYSKYMLFSQQQAPLFQNFTAQGVSFCGKKQACQVQCQLVNLSPQILKSSSETCQSSQSQKAPSRRCSIFDEEETLVSPIKIIENPEISSYYLHGQTGFQEYQYFQLSDQNVERGSQKIRKSLSEYDAQQMCFDFHNAGYCMRGIYCGKIHQSFDNSVSPWKQQRKRNCVSWIIRYTPQIILAKTGRVKSFLF